MSREYADQVAFLGIGGRDSPAAITAFVRDSGFRFPNAIDRGFDLFSRFGVRIQDTWVFFDEDGSEVARSSYEELDEQRLRSYLDRLVSG